MDKDMMRKDLANFLRGLIDSAKEDTAMAINLGRFRGTIDSKFGIVGGWTKGQFDGYGDLLCVSKENPNYAMAVKIVVNGTGDYESLQMPTTEDGNVEDTEIALEWEDDVDSAAAWLISEWERIMKEHGEEI